MRNSRLLHALLTSAPTANFEVIPDLEPYTAAELDVWRGTGSIPQLGQRVRVTLNGLGSGTVRGSFLAGKVGEAAPEDPQVRSLGVAALLENPPAWYTKQNAARPAGEPAFIFGPEVQPL